MDAIPHAKSSSRGAIIIVIDTPRRGHVIRDDCRFLVRRRSVRIGSENDVRGKDARIWGSPAV